MADGKHDKHEKSHRNARDRAAADQQYGLAYFGDKHNLAMDDARRVLEATGENREAADARADGLKQKRPMR
jgi:hypothetical protein